METDNTVSMVHRFILFPIRDMLEDVHYCPMTCHHLLKRMIAALFAAIFWMLALTKLPLNKAYPFLSLSFVTVTLLSSLVLGEHFSILKLAGVVIIVIGVTICGLAK